MNRWRRIGPVWAIWPAKPLALIEMIGGSYLAINPQLSYKLLLESLALESIAIHAWSYVPGFDHQAQANEAWKSLRSCRQMLESRIGYLPTVLRLGHSLGSKLHLLAPDGGRNSRALISMSFNNFGAEQSIPMLRKIAPKLGFFSEFSPSPNETLKLIRKHYLQPKNLLISFGEDQLDQSSSLLECLTQRDEDASRAIHLPGDHLTPASAGLRQTILKEWGGGSAKSKSQKQLIKLVCTCSREDI